MHQCREGDTPQLRGTVAVVQRGLSAERAESVFAGRSPCFAMTLVTSGCRTTLCVRAG